MISPGVFPGRPSEAVPPAGGAPAKMGPVSEAAATESHAERLELAREAVMMAVYVSLSLLAVVFVTPIDSGTSRLEHAVSIFLTALGLVVADMVAFTIANRLIYSGDLDHLTPRVRAAQALGGLSVAVLATIPVLLLPLDVSGKIDFALLGLLIAGTGFWALRRTGASLLAATGYVVGLAAVVLGVIALKVLTHH